jgi:hypothetical protein
MSVTEEIIEVCKALPDDKQAELLDFARFLRARQDDEAWDRRLADSQPGRVWKISSANPPPKALSRLTQVVCELTHPAEFLAGPMPVC